MENFLGELPLKEDWKIHGPNELGEKEKQKKDDNLIKGDNLIKDDKVTMQHKMHDLVSSLTEVVSVTAAVQGVVWVLVLTVVTLYAMGILTTRLYHVGK